MRNILIISTLIYFISCQHSEKGITNSLIESGAYYSNRNETIDFGEVIEGEKVNIEFGLKIQVQGI